ncbi:hypothetical protein R5M74_09940 [Aeromonas hydrophila]|nr:hypothetical protein R5M74_09940 [Aeromonas hydrophila]
MSSHNDPRAKPRVNCSGTLTVAHRTNDTATISSPPGAAGAVKET